MNRLISVIIPVFNTKLYLKEAIDSIVQQNDFIKDIDAVSYKKNIMVKSAVERQFEIIGEILSRMSREFPLAYARIRNARRIIDFRNLISHGYDVLSDERVYQIANENIPELRDDLKNI
jgi:uncharacterized protein with HEPN domain